MARTGCPNAAGAGVEALVRSRVGAFGAGLTSFNEAFIPGISALKIDRSLLRRCCVDDDAFGVLSLVTAFARRQGKLCVAEGIETAQQRQFAEARGASHVQGFFSGRV